MEEEILNPDGFSDWEHLLSSSSPATTSTFNQISHDPFLSIFPPVNHEGLPAAYPLHLPSASDPTTTSDSSTGDPSNHQHSSPSSVSPVFRWIRFALQLLNLKAVSFLPSLRSRVLLFSFPSQGSVCVGGMMTGVSMMVLGVWIWWRKPRRRRDDTIQRLNSLIREKDEKIIELLNQVAQLNKLLLARYRVPVIKGC